MELLSPTQRQIIQELISRRQNLKPTRNEPLWPDEFSNLDSVSAWKFIRRLKTWNEAEQRVHPFPEKEYLEFLANRWVTNWQAGETLVIEKCRRMVVSWLMRGLELWAMGLGKLDHSLVGLDRHAAASHCWRYLHLYQTLSRENPSWSLPPCEVIRFQGERLLEEFSLANGSRTTSHHQDPSHLQGEGKGLVTVEELSRFRSPAQVWSQAKIITQGSAISPHQPKRRGAVVAITNAAMNDEWKHIKRIQMPK